MQQLIISRDRHQTRVALLEDGRAVEFYIEPVGRPTLGGQHIQRTGGEGTRPVWMPRL